MQSFIRSGMSRQGRTIDAEAALSFASVFRQDIDRIEDMELDVEDVAGKPCARRGRRTDDGLN